MDQINHVWVIVGEQGKCTSGVFSDLDSAEQWISLHSLTGLLSQYPLNEGAFDWAVKTERIKRSFAETATPGMIGSFCSYLNYYHYKDSKRVT
jgi:hypothetical protein